MGRAKVFRNRVTGTLRGCVGSTGRRGSATVREAKSLMDDLKARVRGVSSGVSRLRDEVGCGEDLVWKNSRVTSGVTLRSRGCTRLRDSLGGGRRGVLRLLRGIVGSLRRLAKGSKRFCASTVSPGMGLLYRRLGSTETSVRRICSSRTSVVTDFGGTVTSLSAYYWKKG